MTEEVMTEEETLEVMEAIAAEEAKQDEEWRRHAGEVGEELEDWDERHKDQSDYFHQ